MRFSRCFPLAVWSLVVALSPLAADEAAPAPVFRLVKAARLLDPVAGKLLLQQAVLIENDRVKSVGAAAELAKNLPAGATTIDLGDVTLLPGLIDCHTH